MSEIPGFLSNDNLCGQTLLQLVARANVLIADILRLSESVPGVFTSCNGSNKFAEIIKDFSYFQIQEEFEHEVEASERLRELDAEFREIYAAQLAKFFSAFLGIHQYISDLSRFVDELEEGFYVHDTLESISQDPDGKQLLAESLYLLGVMLIIIDLKFPGVVRERLLVSYHRHSDHLLNISCPYDEVCTLLRSSNGNDKRRAGFSPEAYFQRVNLKDYYVNFIIGMLRSDDIYRQLLTFPLPEHRSIALAEQGGMIFVCLFFTLETLRSNAPVMREIVDKYFYDNWVITVHLGITVNLFEAWEPYKAAHSALNSTLQPALAKLKAQNSSSEVQKLNNEIQGYIIEGISKDDFTLVHMNKLMNSIRKSNATLRWLLLHTSAFKKGWDHVKRCRQMRDAVNEAKVNPDVLFEFVLNCAQCELSVKEKLKSIYSSKLPEVQRLQAETVSKLGELIDVFSGSRPLSVVQKNDKVCEALGKLKTQLQDISFDNQAVTGYKVLTLVKNLDELQEMHVLDAQEIIRHFIADVRNTMHMMLRILKLSEDVLIKLQLITDMSYAWEIIYGYTDRMQRFVQKDPAMCVKLRAVFLKLSSGISSPLLRIQQAKSKDFGWVSHFYSKHLVRFVRHVLQIIPQTVFSLLEQIMKLQANGFKEVPTHVNKDQLRDYSQAEVRFQIAKLTNSVSVLAEGMLMLKTTVLGAIEIDPKQLLEDGIRQELLRVLACQLHTSLMFGPRSKGDLLPKLEKLASVIEVYRRSFHYISDYIELCGLKIWQEELKRIVFFNVEQECNRLQRHEVLDSQSIYQSQFITIPSFPSTDKHFGFIGRLASEILEVTNPRNCCHCYELDVWFDLKLQKELLTGHAFETLLTALGNVGVWGLDRYYSFQIVLNLKEFSQTMTNSVSGSQQACELLNNIALIQTLPAGSFGHFCKNYLVAFVRTSKSFSSIYENILRIGHLQIVRVHLMRVLNKSCKINSRLYEDMLRTLNKKILFQQCLGRQHIYSSNLMMADVLLAETLLAKNFPVNVPDPFNRRKARKAILMDFAKDSNGESCSFSYHDPLLYELSAYVESAGIANPIEKIYMEMPVFFSVGIFLFSVVVSVLPRLCFYENNGKTRKPDSIDAVSFAVGVVSVLKQYGDILVAGFWNYSAQFFRLCLMADSKNEFVDLPALLKIFAYLRRFSDSEVVKEFVAQMPSEYVRP